MTPKKHTGRPTFGQMVEKVGTPRLGNDSQYLDHGLSKRQILFSKILLPSLDSKRWQFLPSTHTRCCSTRRIPTAVCCPFNHFNKKEQKSLYRVRCRISQDAKIPLPKKVLLDTHIIKWKGIVHFITGPVVVLNRAVLQHSFWVQHVFRHTPLFLVGWIECFFLITLLDYCLQSVRKKR